MAGDKIDAGLKQILEAAKIMLRRHLKCNVIHSSKASFISDKNFCFLIKKREASRSINVILFKTSKLGTVF